MKAKKEKKSIGQHTPLPPVAEINGGVRDLVFCPQDSGDHYNSLHNITSLPLP